MTDVPSYLPKDWDDDMKMTVMFSPFRDRHLNPKSWEQKMKFWSETILEYSLQQKEAIISVASLREKFRRKGKSPSCLDTVMQEMISKGQLKRLSDIENCTTGSWLSWGYSAFVKKPIGWSMKWLSRQPEETVDESFVVLEVIKEKAQQLLEIRGRLEQTNSINIVEYDHLHEEHRDLCPTDTEFTLVMQELVDTKEVVIQKGDDNTKLVKFLHIKDKKKKTDKINEQDIHLHRVCAVGFVCRPVEKVNKKWRELKSSTKAKERKIRDAKKRTGGGPPPASLKDWEEKIVSVLPDCVVEGVEFGINCFEESEVSVGDMALARTDDEILCHLSLENFLQSTNTPATLGSGKTPATLGIGKTPATLGSGKTPATLGSGKTPATLGSDKTPATLGSGKTPATLGSGKTPATLGSFKESITVQEKENSACSSTSALSITQSGRSSQRSNSRKRSCDCDLQLMDIQKGLLEESKKRNILLEKILNTLQNNNIVLIGGDQQPSS